MCIYPPATCWLSQALDGQPPSPPPADGCSCRLLSVAVGVSPGSSAAGRRSGWAISTGRYAELLRVVDHHLPLLAVDSDAGLVRRKAPLKAAKRKSFCWKLKPCIARGLQISLSLSLFLSVSLFFCCRKGSSEAIMPWSLTRNHTLKNNAETALVYFSPLTFK